MKKTFKNTLAQLVIIVSMCLAVHCVQTQAVNPVGNYVYKTYRKGKGGFENHLEITKAARGKFHVSFEGVYFYMAGKDETFHEGSGEGEGQLNGNVLTATLDDGAGGSCRLTLTFNETLVINEYTVTAKTGRICQLNSSPEGLYRKEVTKKKASGPSEPVTPVRLPLPNLLALISAPT